MPFYNQKTIIKTCYKPRSKGEKSQNIWVGSIDFRAGEIMTRVRYSVSRARKLKSRARRTRLKRDVFSANFACARQGSRVREIAQNSPLFVIFMPQLIKTSFFLLSKIKGSNFKCL
ncbi:hypothetical protein QL285_041039 [Trifolium repens]|nr:hypothetical protein QL285_041039 [Trifolium repens]